MDWCPDKNKPNIETTILTETQDSGFNLPQKGSLNYKSNGSSIFLNAFIMISLSTEQIKIFLSFRSNGFIRVYPIVS